MTSPELAREIRGGTTTVIVPIGGTEQNGPHMALGKHNVRARLLAERIARELGNAVVAPVIAYVPEGSIAPPTGHMRYPGTITIPADAYRKVLEYAARSFRLHGFRDIVFLGDSGDYQRDNAAVAALLNREWAASAGARARDRRVLPGADRLVRAGVEAPRTQRRRDRPARRARGHLADAGARSADGARRPHGARLRARRRCPASPAIRAARPPNSARWPSTKPSGKRSRRFAARQCGRDRIPSVPRIAGHPEFHQFSPAEERS